MRIIFFGTPDFAVASLKAVVEAGVNVAAVVTAPDKPAGRGMQLQASAVKKYAVSAGIPVLQPLKLKEPGFIEELRAFGADLQVVVAFRMLPEQVWSMPPMGTINVHASLLPQYRGAAPVNWAIMNGEVETGVTTFRLQHAIDTGNILLRERVEILPEDNAGTLHDKLMDAGADLLVKTIRGLAAGTVPEIPQPSAAELRHAPKLFKEQMEIRWQKTLSEIVNHIRGLSPYPGAWTQISGKMLKIYEAHGMTESHGKEPGSYETDHRSYLRFAAGDGWVYLDEIQQEGRRRMRTEEFLKGFRG